VQQQSAATTPCGAPDETEEGTAAELSAFSGFATPEKRTAWRPSASSWA